jgi:hypothetical protein
MKMMGWNILLIIRIYEGQKSYTPKIMRLINCKATSCRERMRWNSEAG